MGNINWAEVGADALIGGVTSFIPGSSKFLAGGLIDGAIGAGMEAAKEMVIYNDIDAKNVITAGVASATGSWFNSLYNPTDILDGVKNIKPLGEAFKALIKNTPKGVVKEIPAAVTGVVIDDSIYDWIGRTNGKNSITSVNRNTNV